MLLLVASLESEVVKINNIQEVSGAQINISRGSSNTRTPERIVTIKGTQRAISKAQEMIEEAITHPDIKTSKSSLSRIHAASPRPL
eukprot:Em0006g1083a